MQQTLSVGRSERVGAEPQLPPERRRGRLHVFLGAAPGVGKTLAMLDEGLRLAEAGARVLVGTLETHDRVDLISKVGRLEVVRPREVSYRGISLEEMDLDGLLKRRPDVVLVDELAHTDVPGCRFEKRWQDVAELLDAGIDVLTNLNVQHLESLNDAVEELTGFAQRETVPYAFVASADRIDFLDVEPKVLRARIAEGAVFAHGETAAALAGYFSGEHLAALRELAIGWLEGRDRVEAAAAGRALRSQPPPDRVVAALTGEAEGEHVIRRAAQLAAASGAELVGLHVRSPSAHVGGPPLWLELAVLVPAVLAFALLPVRSSLGIAGELFCMLLAVVLVAVIGGWRPAVLATVTGFLLAEFLYAPPYYSLRVSHVSDVVALVVFAVVAVVVGGLVDVLTRQGVRVARARAEATGLARLLAAQLAGDSGALSQAAGELRRIFDLDCVAVLRPTDGGWESEQSAGAPIPQSPEAAQFRIELANRRVLALTGSRLQEEDAELLQTLLATVRQIHERDQTAGLSKRSEP